ncbi:MAG: NUDIX domain-containing protein [Bifidobacteriaceae bacterium]|nr:NUDIX domain-containing protein [Bifidobacteriaceae bacterium]
MPTPDFILNLRNNIGHNLLWLIGVTAFIKNDRGEILLAKRADSGQWALISGICEPGENPADTVIREAQEETCLSVCIEHFVCVSVSPIITYPNNDKAQYLDHAFSCVVDGDSSKIALGDNENLDIRWFNVNNLPNNTAQTTLDRLQILQKFEENLKHNDCHTLYYLDTTLQ